MNSPLGKLFTTLNKQPYVKCIFKGRIITLPLGGEGTLIQHLEATIICEESSTNVDGNRVILDIYLMMKGEKKKVKKPLDNSKTIMGDWMPIL
jgi:hypothetical protein